MKKKSRNGKLHKHERSSEKSSSGKSSSTEKTTTKGSSGKSSSGYKPRQVYHLDLVSAATAHVRNVSAISKGHRKHDGPADWIFSIGPVRVGGVVEAARRGDR
jgi:hypothetical protein